MKKLILMITVVLLLVVILAATVLWFTGGQELYAVAAATSAETVADDYALQDDAAVVIPKPRAREPAAANPLKNLYWGELHVHTQESFDAKLFGNNLGLDDAYRFARGQALRSDGGELMQLSRPLDFMAITDHAESFGLRTRCADSGLSWSERLNCYFLETPNTAVFLIIGTLAGASDVVPESVGRAGHYQNRARPRPSYNSWPLCAADEDPQRCFRDSNSDWARYKALADANNVPGEFTTFAAYEYSAAMSASGKHHRNVIFNGADLPEHAVSSLDVGNAIELWQALEATCTGDCDFMTIPHNMNKGWGLFYSPYTWDGKAYDEAAWALRKKREPLAEMYQIKGASECALGVGSTDEECGFGQVLPPCVQGQLSGCAFTTSFVRQGLRTGLQLQRDLGFNPMTFGFIAATDSHNANPGDAEEWDYVGKIGTVTSPALRRMTQWPDQQPYESTLQHHTSGGLAAVWARENTRDAIFAAMQRRETYATSGPRIGLRFFAGWDVNASLLDNPDALQVLSTTAVPMGATLPARAGNASATDAAPASPGFFVWAVADTMSAPLQRIQMVKGWIDAAGQTHERVQDIACADGLVVDASSGRCPDNGADVDTASCALLGDAGAAQLMTVWHDDEFDANQNAFYYVRVLQNPTCRWSTYDAIRLGRAPPAAVPATLRERAWSSPIWTAARRTGAR